MCPASDPQKRYRYLLPVVLVCLLVVLVSFSGCISGLPGLSGISFPGSGSSTGTANPPAYDTVQTQVTQTPATGTGAGSCRQGLTPCAGNCVDITVDIGNCGGCGMTCPANAYCNEGACYCKDGYEATAQGTCIHVTAPSAGTTDTGQNQQYSCADNPGTTSCGDGYCWYLTEDNHCGSCDNPCPVDQTCANGQCVPSQNSGYAPTICSSDSDCAVTSEQQLLLQQMHEKMICTQGTCIPACISKYNNCDGNVQNGCEASLSTDTSNCGLCGKTCTPIQICSEGNCIINPAVDQLQRCTYPNSLCSGVCVNTQTDEANCGSCGRTCGSGLICLSGNCAINPALLIQPRVQMCASPYSVCSGDCVNLQTDANNCGSCGTTCPTNGGYCSSGTCHCPTGYINSNGVCKIVSIEPKIVQPIVNPVVNPVVVNPIIKKNIIVSP